MIDVGQTYPATATVTGSDGKPANATTAVLTITLPDGTDVVPAVQNPPVITGLYAADYKTVQAGLHKASWLTTQPDAATVDYFSVRRYLSVISFAEAKNHLNITTTTDDDELRQFIQASAELIESKVGICVRRDFTDRVSRGTYQLAVAHRPILKVNSVTSIWPGGPAWPAEQLTADTEAGLVQQIQPMQFYWGPWDVSISCGRAEIPERFAHAQKEQLRHLWETQRGPMSPQILGGEEVFATTAGWTFSVPRRVLELLEDDMDPAL